MIIEGTQICIPVARTRALAVLGSMVKLLRDRHHYKVTRRQFLVRWSKLRKALFLTRDYQELRNRVFAAAGGKCQICFERACEHMHHKVRVSRNPMLALVESNCQAACRRCHKEIDDV